MNDHSQVRKAERSIRDCVNFYDNYLSAHSGQSGGLRKTFELAYLFTDQSLVRLNLVTTLLDLEDVSPMAICWAIRKIGVKTVCDMLGFIGGHPLLGTQANLCVACKLLAFDHDDLHDPSKLIECITENLTRREICYPAQALLNILALREIELSLNPKPQQRL